MYGRQCFYILFISLSLSLSLYFSLSLSLSVSECPWASPGWLGNMPDTPGRPQKPQKRTLGPQKRRHRPSPSTRPDPGPPAVPPKGKIPRTRIPSRQTTKRTKASCAPRRPPKTTWCKHPPRGRPENLTRPRTCPVQTNFHQVGGEGGEI